MAAESIESSFSEETTSTHTRGAFISDTHLGSLSELVLTSQDFLDQCEEISTNPEIDFVALTGDILDKKAGLDDIHALRQGLQSIIASGKPVLYVWGNNEDRLQETYDLRGMLEEMGEKVKVFDGTEDTAYIITLPNGKRQAFVGAPRILTQQEHSAIMHNGGSALEQILDNRKIVNGEQLTHFKNALASTIIETRDPDTGILTREIVSTTLLFHAYENVAMYDKYKHLADDPLVKETELFKQAIIAHQKVYHNIHFGLFGHVEGGEKSFTIELPEGEEIPFFNTCATVIDKRFLVAA